MFPTYKSEKQRIFTHFVWNLSKNLSKTWKSIYLKRFNLYSYWKYRTLSMEIVTNSSECNSKLANFIFHLSYWDAVIIKKFLNKNHLTQVKIVLLHIREIKFKPNKLYVCNVIFGLTPTFAIHELRKVLPHAKPIIAVNYKCTKMAEMTTTKYICVWCELL